MKIGMPQLFEYDELEKNFKLAKRLGLDFIELNLNFASCREALENKKVLDLVNKYQVETTLHFFDEADFGSYQEVVDAYLSYLDNYARLGQGFIKQINVHLNPGPVVTIAGIKHYVYEKEYDQYIARLMKNLKEAEEICRKYDINLVIENVEYMPLYSKRTYNDLFDNGFRFCYDIGHDHLSDDLLLNVIKVKAYVRLTQLLTTTLPETPVMPSGATSAERMHEDMGVFRVMHQRGSTRRRLRAPLG